MAEFTGQMRYLTLIPNGTFGDNKIQMYKAVLQDVNTMELHEFNVNDNNPDLIKTLNTTTPMTNLQCVIELKYDRFALVKGKSPSKFVLQSVKPMISKNI